MARTDEEAVELKKNILDGKLKKKFYSKMLMAYNLAWEKAVQELFIGMAAFFQGVVVITHGCNPGAGRDLVFRDIVLDTRLDLRKIFCAGQGNLEIVIGVSEKMTMGV